MLRDQMARYGEVRYPGNPEEGKRLTEEVKHSYVGDEEIPGAVTGVPRHSYAGDDD
jgi:hypothetical protein